ncbi:MAG: DUF4112 domain-containing protein [Scytonema sp. PMC 1069.18]|nr:DUF4112 domain-containing protein [Scytonema sp. PMC 1069.18]MEC4880506.1 DUF4112 domain-containing protein [Scytonema sp. PMC 1070.18]
MSELPPSYSTVAPEAKAPTLRRLRQISRVLDKAVTIPGTQIGIGLDPILGFLPVGGDFIGILFSSYIVLEAARLGAPASTVGKMIVNIIIDGLLGAVPLIGDLFDFAWKANEYNIKLLEDHLILPTQRRSEDKSFVFAVLIALFVVIIGLVALTVIIVRLLGMLLGLFS